MSKIKFKSFFSIIASKCILKLSETLFKGGSNFPGKVALMLDNHILRTISKGYTTILVTGTNGKTTTTSMIYNILKENGRNVITNNTGANMNTGIVACFISNYNFTKSNSDKYAVIEVDEAYLKTITEDLTPKIITVTNLFRDQLDRYGEVYTTYAKIMEGISKAPSSTLILNGDESLLGKLDVSNPIVYYGFNSSVKNNNKASINADSKFCKICKNPYSYHFITYSHLGNYYCTECGYKRPELKYYVDNILELTSQGSSISFNSEEYFINQAGEYNIYNGLCAFAIAKELEIENSSIRNSLQRQNSSFGRQETIIVEGKEVKIILVKNPAGYDQAVNTILLDSKHINLAVLLNDNYADGTDVSWIWDVDFEKFNSISIENIVISGTRLYDMAVRLKIAGLQKEKFILCENDDELMEAIKSSNNTTYILATYTAMLHLRKLLHSKGYIKKIW
ncbi:Mur ligase family protein [Clostridium sp.]|uniref:Mur ligase family protein n=1 Tax=Clostridium sp. TaxID=1506 RepID=UPI002FC7546F